MSASKTLFGNGCRVADACSYSGPRKLDTELSY